MFTGIIREVGEVKARASGSLAVAASSTARACSPGDSVCVSGACLTVEKVEGIRLRFSLTPETEAKTTLGRIRPGARVNIEPSLRAGDLMGGHVVLGHVDGIGTVTRFSRRGDSAILEATCPAELRPALAPKGAVALDGVSLTIAESSAAGIAVSLVKYTLEQTTLGALREGQAINVEADILAKYVQAAVAAGMAGREPGISLEALEEEGYL
jgi:riboflavin synthase alpha subunit